MSQRQHNREMILSAISAILGKPAENAAQPEGCTEEQLCDFTLAERKFFADGEAMSANNQKLYSATR